MSIPLSPVGDSVFINHPVFGDVYKTTFQKGIITDFEVISTDPFKVSSKVKVAGEWGESDYIPIWFRPKSGFWDTEDHDATGYNSAGQYYENAWMSFRCGDEVTVMVKEGSPVAVIGFADGVPRIGEDLFKVVLSGHTCEMKADIRDIYGGAWDLDMKGPDDLGLELTRKCNIKIINEEEVHSDPYWTLISGYYYGSGGSETPYYEGETGDPYDEWYHVYKRSYTINKKQNYVITVPVGPILYAIYYYVIQLTSVVDIWVNEGQGGGDSAVAPDHFYGEPGNFKDIWLNPKTYDGSWTQSSFAAEAAKTSWPSPCINIEFEATGITPGDFDMWGTYILTGQRGWLGIATAPVPPNPEKNIQYDPSISWLNVETPPPVGAALYKSELEQNPVPEDFIKQSEFTDNFFYRIDNLSYSGVDMEVFVRPHTKSELQAAGMWPDPPTTQ